MKNLFLLLALFSPISAHALDDQHYLKPGFTRFIFPQEAEYVAEMQYENSPDTVRVFRSGDMVREVSRKKGITSISVGDNKTGNSFQYSIDANGVYQSLIIAGPEIRYERTIMKTNEIDTLLGEKCVVWVLKMETLTEKDCVTEDGVVLWHKVFGSRVESPLTFVRAVSLERRSVKREEITLPADLLDIATWFGEGDGSQKDDNYEVYLEATSGQSDQSILIRHMGDLWMSHEKRGRGDLDYYASEDVFISVSIDKDGVLDRIDVKRTDAPRNNYSDGERLSWWKSRTALEEQCYDYDMAVGVFDYGEIQCRTKDGIPLIKDVMIWGAQTSFVAKRVSRGGVQLEDVIPPVDLLSKYAPAY